MLAAQHGRSTEAEICDILERAVKPAERVHLGEALAALGRKVGVANEDIAITDRMRDKSPAEPMKFDRARQRWIAEATAGSKDVDGVAKPRHDGGGRGVVGVGCFADVMGTVP